MRYLLCFLMIACSSMAIAQFDVTIDGMIGYDQGVSGASSRVVDRDGNPLPSVSHHDNSYLRYGFNFGFRIGGSLVMKTGLRYATIGSTFKQGDIRWPSEIGPGGWVLDPSLPRSIKVITAHRFAEIPMVARYEFSKKRWQPFVEAGLSAAYYHNTKTTTESLTTSSMVERRSPQDVGQLNLSAVIGLGVQYVASDNYQVFINPTYRVQISKFNTLTGERYATYGVELGVRRRLSTFAE